MDSAITSSRTSPASKIDADPSPGLIWLSPPVLIAFICLVTIAAYEPVLFNFFAGDDFVHLTWLKDAVHNPELILRNFHSSWLDGTTTRFYRPLISIFMVTDYLAWHANGLGFHITNLVFLLIGSASLFAVVRQLGTQDHQESRYPWWPFSAALLFALYPLHPEAVSWITGRVNVIVTAFFLASLQCYLRWRQSNSLFWFTGSALTMILGLLSKEMAIILPATFAAYELFVNSEYVRSSDLVKNTGRALHRTWVFWCILAGYFAIRRWALGTFVGGYDDSLFFIANWHEFLSGWLHGLIMFLIPVNIPL